MDTATITAWFVALLTLITGLSHIAHPRPWSQLFRDLVGRSYAGLVVGMPALIIGLFVLLGHWRWRTDLRLIVTIIGCAWTLKGTLYLLYPGLLARVAGRHIERPTHFRLAGFILMALGGLVAAELILHPAAPGQ